MMVGICIKSSPGQFNVNCLASLFFIYNICKFRGIVTQMKKKIRLFQQVIGGYLKSKDTLPVRKVKLLAGLSPATLC